MSGLVLSALVLFCLLIPGFIFQFRYYRSAAEKWTTSDNINTTTPRALLIAVLFSLPMHAVWGFLISWIDSFWIPIGRINFNDLILLLTGNVLPNGSSTFLQLNHLLLWKITAYLSSQAWVAFLLGNLAATTAESIGWNKLVALGARGAFWHRTLGFPESDPDGIVVSLAVPVCGTTYLYYGLLHEYELDVDGNLQRVVLQAAGRRALAADKNTEPYFIPGEYFIVNCRNVDTVDIDYFWLDDDAEAPSAQDVGNRAPPDV